jgi:predicted type IV restriction endonuclease
MPLKAGARMSLDSSFEKAKLLCADIQGRIPEIETEQDARVQVINRFLTEILGWSFPDIKTEKYNVAGYADYLISSGERRRLVIEAKRIGPIVLNTANTSMATYKVGGPALNSAASGISQAASYCLDHGVHYAALTTGITWIAFLPFPAVGVAYRDGRAIVFPTLQSIIDNFAVFYDLFSKQGVTQRHFTPAGTSGGRSARFLG